MSHSSVFRTYSEVWTGKTQFECFTAVLLTTQGVWSVTPCSPDVSNDSCLHLQRFNHPVTLRHIPRDLDPQAQFSATCHVAVARQQAHSASLHSILDSAVTGCGVPTSLVFTEAPNDCPESKAVDSDHPAQLPTEMKNAWSYNSTTRYDFRLRCLVSTGNIIFWLLLL